MSLAEYLDSQVPEKPATPPAPQAPNLVMDQREHITSNIQQREVAPDRDPHPMEGQDQTQYGRDYQAALNASSAERNYWVPPPEHDAKNTMAQAIWESAKRDSFIGNTIRWMEQASAEVDRNTEQEIMIWDNREELTDGISAQYHDAVLGAPTMDMAIKESQKIRHREKQLLIEHNQSIGKTLVADIAGFIIDPSNLLPGYGMLKGVQVAKRMNSLVAVGKGVSQSPKMQQMAALTAAGGFEEAIRMAPRYQSDPTFETNEYVANIAMSAAMSGFLPVAFGGIRTGMHRGMDILPQATSDLNARLHAWGVDVGVRQAMKFPGALKDTGFKDPGTAARKSKEAAQDAVNAKVKEGNARQNTKQFKEALDQDMAGDTPTVENTGKFFEDWIERMGDAAQGRVLVKTRKSAITAAGTVAGGVVGGPMGAVLAGGVLANRDYIKLGAKIALKVKQRRRVAYDAAVARGDTAKKAEILRNTKESKAQPASVDEAVEITKEVLQEQMEKAVNDAKWAIRDIIEKAKAVC